MAISSRPFYAGNDRDDRDRRLSARNLGHGRDTRTEAQRDKDRITYSTPWRRLVAVTQVITPFDDVPLMHNRLTHSEKVAQVARSIAEKILLTARDDSSGKIADLLERLGGYDADVCEAAGLAHDLGHPPFGHIGEQALDSLARGELQLRDGFEGNAQSIRIVTVGRIRSQKYEGLDLTMATLNAIAKYPWMRAEAAVPTSESETSAEAHETRLKVDPLYARHWKKFNFYDSEKQVYDACRAFVPTALGGANGDHVTTQSLEASTMDVADDITYAVHDLEDAFISRILDIEAVSQDLALVVNTANTTTPFDDLRKRLEFEYDGIFNAELFDEAAKEVRSFLEKNFSRTMLSDSEAESFARQGGSDLVGRYIGAVDVTEEPAWPGGPHVSLAAEQWHEVQVLKEITRSYVIKRPDIALLQIGQQSIIESLVLMLAEWVKKDRDRLPPKLKYEVGIAEAQRVGDSDLHTGYKHGEHAPRGALNRVVLDYVCTLGDIQCATLYYKLSGTQIHRIGLGLAF